MPKRPSKSVEDEPEAKRICKMNTELVTSTPKEAKSVEVKVEEEEYDSEKLFASIQSILPITRNSDDSD